MLRPDLVLVLTSFAPVISSRTILYPEMLRRGSVSYLDGSRSMRGSVYQREQGDSPMAVHSAGDDG